MSDAAPAKPTLLIEEMAAAAKMTPAGFYAAVKVQSGCPNAPDEHFLALLMTAKTYGLNPILGEIVLTENQGKIKVAVPIDGRISLMRRDKDYIAHDLSFEWAPGKPRTRESALEGNLWSATITIWTKTRKTNGLPPFVHTEFFSECYMHPKRLRDGSGTFNGPWQSHPIRMLSWKAINQGSRREFGISVPDVDEVARISEDPTIAEARAIDLTPAVPIRALTTEGAAVLAPARRPEEEPALVADDLPPPPAAAAPESEPDYDSPEGRALSEKLNRAIAEASIEEPRDR